MNRDEYRQKRNHLYKIVEPYLSKFEDDDDGTGLRADTPFEIRETYDEYLRFIHVGTDEDRRMVNTWFQIIKPYAIFTEGNTIKAIRDDAPVEVKEAYEKLKRSGIVITRSGFILSVH